MPIAINGSGTVTGISVGGLPDGCVDTDTLATSVTRGKILQIVQATKTDTFSDTSTNFVDVTGLSVSITPTISDSKILLQCNLQFGGGLNLYAPVRLLRGSTHIGQSTVYSGGQTNATFSLNLGDGLANSSTTFII